MIAVAGRSVISVFKSVELELGIWNVPLNAPSSPNPPRCNERRSDVVESRSDDFLNVINTTNVRTEKRRRIRDHFIGAHSINSAESRQTRPSVRPRRR